MRDEGVHGTGVQRFSISDAGNGKLKDNTDVRIKELTCDTGTRMEKDVT